MSPLTLDLFRALIHVDIADNEKVYNFVLLHKGFDCIFSLNPINFKRIFHEDIPNT